eukprot:CAMPEP_0113529652 /NCGR_PEP_ID=MMETSP0015_2-20120614/2512_1 /TAXON_ID=2838 /ORGANISM="Odontella" /LENGTH=868 /DNA_ID=CAMNT_0000428305 /DNA_START=333 /DNA_END=2939 /DNA_ORIENTATION=+ /assembly_acc=CAM_ASM_000160
MGDCFSKDTSDDRTTGQMGTTGSKHTKKAAGGTARGVTSPDKKAAAAPQAPPASSPPAGTKMKPRMPATPSIREGLIGLHAKARTQGGAAAAGAGAPIPEGNEGEEDPSLHLPEDSRRPQELATKTEATRLRNIFAAPIQVDADFEAPVHPKSDADAEFISAALEGNFVFSNLGKDESKTLVDAFEKTSISRGETVITQGEVGDYFYILQSGTVNFQVNGNEVGSVGAGGSFGELALLYDCPRAATCVSAERCEIWRVDQNTFRKILASTSMKNDTAIRDILKQVPFLTDLDEKYLNKISEALSEMKVNKGDKIIRKGDEGKVFYVIKDGKVRVHDIEVGQSKYDDQHLSSGGYFGERALVTEEKRVANITASSDECTLLCLSKEDFVKILGDLKDLILKTADKQKLKAMPMFDLPGIREYEISTMAELVDEIDYPKGHTFFSEGDPVSGRALSLFIIREGTIVMTNRVGKIHTLTTGGYFGDKNIAGSADDATVIAKNTIQAESDCRVGVLTLRSVTSVLGSTKRLRKVDEDTAHPNKLDTNVKMEDLKKHRILGVGTFGKVWLVSKKTDKKKEAFALKIQNKRDLLEYNQVDGVLREKNVMASIDSPFVIKLVNTYQDAKFIYMLLKLVQGGELFSVLHTDSRDGVSEMDSKFYAAGILEGLSYMHNRHILYRDLKPENVLVDERGYTVIVDLGFAKIVMDKTYTLCGTPLYLAPEVILSRGHDKGADYWSWGVLIYEMIVGVTPFYDHGIEQLELFKKIVQGRFIFPRSLMSTEARDIVRKLLTVRPSNRLGVLAGGDRDIRGHPWFADFDFDAMMNKEIKAPWVPKLKDPLDVSNFDNWDHLDTPPDKKQKALNVKEQDMFKDF